MENKTSQSGFTLIELIAVMVILGILAAVLIPRMTSVSESAYEVNAKQMYSAIESHLYMQSQQRAITGAHGVESFPKVPEAAGNYYLDDWIKDYDSEHWTQWNKTAGGLLADAFVIGAAAAAAQDAIYFLYHPHSTFAGAVPANAVAWTAGLTVTKDVYYITYFPLTSSIGKYNGIENDEFHLSLHKDSNQNQTAEFTDPDAAVDLFHCGGDDKDPDGGSLPDEISTTACAMH